MHTIMGDIVNEHKETYNEDTMRNVTDVYLKEIATNRDPNFNGNSTNCLSI